MAFNLKKLINENQGNARVLHEQGINPVFSNVLEMIGFTHEYSHGEGCHLTTHDGVRVLDGLSGYGVFGMGRNHPVIVQAIRDAMDADLPNLVQMDNFLLSGLLAKKLLSLAPGERLEHVFFTNSGTEAVEGAIKFVRATTGRPRIFFTKSAFHGLSTGSLSLNGDESFREGFGELFPGSEKWDYSDLDALKHELAKRDVAAVMLEPIRGKGALFPHDDSIYPRLQKICRETDTLLVADEIQTGLGRTGRWWACDHWNLEPDILLTAKALSGGLVPVGAILYSKAIYKKVFSRLDRCVVHSSTFGQNALAMAAGLATLSVLEEENLIERSAKQGKRLLGGLKALQEKHGFIHDVRGKGLMVGIEFGSPKSFKLKPAWALLHSAQKGLFAQAVVMQLFQKHQILTQVAGHNQEIIKFLPPYIISDKDIDHIITSMDAVMNDCKRFPGPVWLIGKQLLTAAAKQHLFKGTKLEGTKS